MCIVVKLNILVVFEFENYPMYFQTEYIFKKTKRLFLFYSVWLAAVPVFRQGKHNLPVSQTKLLMTVLMDSRRMK